MKKILLPLMLLLCAGGAQAQSDYHNQKTSLYETLPVGRRDIVFLGNSLTDGCEWAELLGNPRIRNRGINSDNTAGMLLRLDPILRGQPRKLFLLAGVNDLGERRDPAAVVENIARILDRFRDESPRTALYVQSLLPVNDTFGRFKSYRDGALDQPIREVNRRLRELCAERGVTFIDLYPLFVDEQGRMRAELTNDGLHLVGEGYLIWKQALEKYVR